MDIQGIDLANNTNNVNNNPTTTPTGSYDSIDLNAIYQQTYEAEMAKYEAEAQAAKARAEAAQIAAEQAQANATATGNITSVVTYTPEQIQALQQQALALLLQQAQAQQIQQIQASQAQQAQAAQTQTQQKQSVSTSNTEQTTNQSSSNDTKKAAEQAESVQSAYLQKNEQKPTISSVQTGTGKAISIPSSIAQTGIIKNYTNYKYFYGKWTKGSAQRALSEQWNASGRTSDRGIATLNNRYLVAVSPKFGKVGDNIDVKLDDGTVIPCTIADAKGTDAKSEWGHTFNGAVDVIEWESMGNQSVINTDGWNGHKVTTIINQNMV